jgi:hypothetical protein
MLNGMLTKNWAFELGFNKMISTDKMLSFDVDLRRNCDHAGLFFRAYLGRFGFEANVYDIRHHNDKNTDRQG